MGKIDYSIFSMLWAVILGILFLEKERKSKSYKKGRNIPSAPRKIPMPPVKDYESIGFNDNSNLEGMRYVPTTEAPPPKPPCKQPITNSLTITIGVDFDFDKFKEQWDEAQKMMAKYDLNTNIPEEMRKVK